MSRVAELHVFSHFACQFVVRLPLLEDAADGRSLVAARASDHSRRHHGAQRGTCPPLLICRGHGGTDNRYKTFDTLVNWALGSHLANKDTVM